MELESVALDSETWLACHDRGQDGGNGVCGGEEPQGQRDWTMLDGLSTLAQLLKSPGPLTRVVSLPTAAATNDHKH